MDYKIILDLIIAVLLAATIGYAVLLNRQLSSLRKNRDELAKIILNFNEATVRAEASVPKLRKAAEEAGADLQQRVEKAQSLRDDLAFMIERADQMAGRLENTVRTVRNETKASPRPSPKARGGSGNGGKESSGQGASGQPREEDQQSEAERELLRALQAVR